MPLLRECSHLLTMATFRTHAWFARPHASTAPLSCALRRQLRQHGKEDEKACRFCKAPLPPWPEELQAELAKEVPNPVRLDIGMRLGLGLQGRLQLQPGGWAVHCEGVAPHHVRHHLFEQFLRPFTFVSAMLLSLGSSDSFTICAGSERMAL